MHGDGEIWAQTLWSIRRALVAAHGDGVGRARRYITEGLRLAPPEPSFLDLRNAILAASVAGGDEDLLWTVFAKRGMGYFAGTADSADVAPVADFTDPASLSGTGTLTGTVRDEDGQAVAGASVGIAGLDSGVGPAHVATTGQSGAYAIGQIPTNGTHPFPVVRARKPGYAEDRELSVTVPVNGSTTVPFTIPRDWSSPVNAAAIGDFTGPDNTSSGCGPGGLVDDDPGTVWGTTRQAAGQRITVALGAPVDIAQVEIDPSAGCGDDQSAALGSYEVLGATARGGPYTPLAAGAFGAGDLGELRSAFSGNQPAVRFLQLLAKTPQSGAAGTAGATYVDVAELHVGKVPGSPLGAAADTGAAQAVGTAGATLTGVVAPYGGAAQVIFEYGTTTGYGASVAAGSTPAGGAAGVPLSAAVAGLQPGTTYHFRVVALRDGRRYEGADATFTTAGSPGPAPTPEGTPSPSPTATVTIQGKRLKASRKGMIKVRVRFGAKAPSGTARLTVLKGKRRLAVATLAVRPGRTVTKTLRLNARGRKAIRPGHARKVTLELKLPGGKKVKKTVKLTRLKR